MNLSIKEIIMDKTKLMQKGISLPVGFSAGYAREVVNAENGTSLGGYGLANAKVRLSQSVKDDLKLTCTAVSDGDEAVLIYSVDSCHIAESITNPLFKMIEEELGVPASNVIFNPIHTHSAPVLYTDFLPGLRKYLDEVFNPAAVRLAEAALRDLASAKIFAGTAKTSGLSFVRRYVSLDGKEFLGNWPETILSPNEARHESDHDERMQIIRFAREDKKDIVMCNWQCHPTSASGEEETYLSADWVGVLRNIVEAEKDVNFVYHQGAAGNIICFGMLEGENNFDGDKYVEHGALIAKVAMEIMDNLTPVKEGKVQAAKRFLTVNRKGDDGRTANIPISALAIGDAAFATVPYEMFSANGAQVKDNSPFDVTFMCELTNGEYNYVPAEESFDLGGYEVRVCPFVKGTGEQVAMALVDMLKELYASR